MVGYCLQKIMAVVLSVKYVVFDIMFSLKGTLMILLSSYWQYTSK